MSILIWRPMLRLRYTPVSQLIRKHISTSHQSSGGKQETKSITTNTDQHSVSTDVRPLGERVKENTKTASYMGVIVLGCTVTGIMFFAIFRELFSANSPNSIYTAALKKCTEDPRIQDKLGAPVKGFGEETRRGRRQHVAHSVYQRNGIDHMKMHFYIQGIRGKGTVFLEMRKNQSGNYEYRYIFVQLDDYLRTTLIIEDNRIGDSMPSGQNLLVDDFKL